MKRQLQNLLGTVLRRFDKRLRRPVCRKLFRDDGGDCGRSIMVVGSGRSGTTWLAEIVDAMLPSRIMFEPFNGRYVPSFATFDYFHYQRPGEENEQLLSYSQTVFSGSIRHPWIDRRVHRLFPRFRVIKDIRSTLFLKWIHLRFPRLPMLFIVRHPCAVVLSRMRLDWATDKDIAPFLGQRKLIEDHLKEKVELVRVARTEEEKHAIIWCIHNLVPLAQFGHGELHVIFYERLCLDPAPEIARIRSLLERPPFEGELADISGPLKRIDVASTTATRESAIMTGRDRIARWREELTVDQIERVLSVVEAFGLGGLYGDSVTPVGDVP